MHRPTVTTFFLLLGTSSRAYAGANCATAFFLPDPLPASSFQLPVVPYNSDGYDFAEPLASIGKRHLGTDAVLPAKSPVKATANGNIIYSCTGVQDYEQVIVMEHKLPDGAIVTSVYGHLSKRPDLPLRGTGYVNGGETIGYVGFDDENGTGGPHLHFAIRMGEHPGMWVYYGRSGRGEDVDVDRTGVAIGGLFTNPEKFIQMRTVSNGTVLVSAGLDGATWAGPVNYSVGTGSMVVPQTSVPGTPVIGPPGLYAVNYTSGGPPNSTFLGIGPCPLATPPSSTCTQTLNAGQTLTFTLQFRSNPPTAGFLMSANGQALSNGQALNLSVPVGNTATVSFNASASQAFNGATITRWVWTSNNTIIGTTSAFSADFPIGSHNISLVVTDNRNVQSQPAYGTVVVTASAAAFLLVGNGVTHGIQRFNAATGALVDTFASGGGLLTPQMMAFGPGGHLFVADTHSRAVYRYDGSTGAALPSPGNSGAVFVPPGSGGLIQPGGVAFSADGMLYVGDTGTLPGGTQTGGTIRTYSGTTATPISTWVTGGNVGAITRGPDGHLYISDYAAHRIMRFNGGTGAPLPAPGNTGADFVASGIGGLLRPEGLVFGNDGNLYVSNAGTNQILRYGPTGAPLGTFCSTNSPYGIAFGPDGNLYVSNLGYSTITRYHGQSGALIDTFVPPSGGLQNGNTFLLFSSPSQPPTANPSLLSYWRFEGNSTDSKGAVNGSDTAVTYGTDFGKIGQGAGFDGVSSRILFGDVYDVGTGPFTVAAWVKPSGGIVRRMILGKKRHGQVDAPGWALYWTDAAGGTQTSLGLNSSNGVLEETCYGRLRNASELANTWHHVAVVRGLGFWKLFLNGVDDSAFGCANTSINLDNDIPFFIGDNQAFVEGKFFGAMDEVMIFSRALTAAEITALYRGEPALAGTIRAKTNLPSPTFTITGPATHTGAGTSFARPNAPAGTHTITVGAVPKYVTPSTQTATSNFR